MSCVRLGLRETWSERPAIAGSILTYALLLGVWASLWKLVPDAALARLSLRYEQLVWYFALTELVPFSVGHCYRQIESEIQAGGATPYLVRPIGYTALCGMLELGHTAAKLAFIGPAGCALAFLLTGTVPLGAAQVPPLAVLLVGGASIYLGVQIMIGLSTAWFGTARPLFFIVQKLVFVLGGLIVPLSAYPGVLERVAWLTPFPATLYAPASLALEPGFAHVGGMLVLQAFWLALVLAALAGVAGAFERRLMANGEA